MKGPINPKDIKIGKPDLGGITTEVWINTLRGQIDALRKELDQAKKDIANMRKTINSQSSAIGDLSANFSAKIAALEKKAAGVVPHVHRYGFADVQVAPISVPNGSGGTVTVPSVTAFVTQQETSQPI